MTMLKNNKRAISIVLLFLVILGSLMSIAISYSYAEDVSTNTVKLEDVKGYISMKKEGIDETSSIVNDAIRSITFGIAKTLVKISEGTEEILKKSYRLLTIGQDQRLINLFSRFRVLYKVLFMISVTALGVYLLFAKQSISDMNIIPCILTMVLIIFAYPVIISQLSNITINSSDFVIKEWNSKGNNNITTSIINDTVYDLQVAKINEKTSDVKAIKKKNSFNDNFSLSDIETNETIDSNGMFAKKLNTRYQNNNNIYLLNDLDKSLIKEEKYYRYQVASFPFLYASLLGSIIVMLFMIIRLLRFIWEIGMSYFYNPIISATDIHNGKRIQEALKGVVTMFMSIFLIVILYSFYLIGINFINNNELIKNTYIFKTIAFVSLCWAIIDGATIIQRVLGIDIGLKSAWSLIASNYMLAKGGGRIAKNTAKSVSHGFKNTYNKVKSGKANKDMSNSTNTTNNSTNEKPNKRDISNSKGDNKSNDKFKKPSLANKDMKYNPLKTPKKGAINRNSMDNMRNKTAGSNRGSKFSGTGNMPRRMQGSNNINLNKNRRRL